MTKSAVSFRFCHFTEEILNGELLFCAVCIMKDSLLSLPNLEMLRKEMQPTYKFVLNEKYFPFLFTHFCLDLSSMLDNFSKWMSQFSVLRAFLQVKCLKQKNNVGSVGLTMFVNSNNQILL